MDWAAAALSCRSAESRTTPKARATAGRAVLSGQDMPAPVWSPPSLTSTSPLCAALSLVDSLTFTDTGPCASKVRGRAFGDDAGGGTGCLAASLPFGIE
jgi:hypothetical protein